MKDSDFGWGEPLLIHEGTAEDIHNCFITERTDERVLVIFLGATRDDKRLVSELIDQVVEIDAIIGREIGFLVCDPQGKTKSKLVGGEGESQLIGAEFISPNKKFGSARKFLSEADDWMLTDRKASEILAHSTISLVPDFMELYGIERSKLPCLVCLFKGMSDYAVLEVPHDPSFNNVLDWLNSIKEIYEDVNRDILMADISQWDLSQRLQRSEELRREREAKIKKIKTAALGAVARNIDDQEFAMEMTAKLSSQALNAPEKSEEVGKLLSRLPDAGKDGRWEKILRLQERVDDLALLDIANLEPRGFENLKTRLEHEISKIEELSNRIAHLSLQGSNRGHGRRTAVAREPQTWQKIDRVNTATDVLDKLNRGLEFVIRLMAG